VTHLSFRLFGVPIRVEPFFFVVLVLLGFTAFSGWLLVSWVAIAAASVLLHEGGHAVAFRAFGHRPSITLQGFGGVTSAEADLTPGRGIVVSLAGPLSALVLFGLPAWVLYASGSVTSYDAEVILGQVLFVNVGWSLLNLLPILPLDGGHVTRSVLDLVTDGRGDRPARIVSILVAGALGVWALSVDALFAAILGLLFVSMNITELSRAKSTAHEDEVAGAVRRILARDPRGALAAVDAVLARRPTGVTLARALDIRAWCLLALGDLRGATATLERFPSNVQPSARTQGALALAEGRTDEGVTLLTYALSRQANDVETMLIAQFLAGTGLVDLVARELVQLDGARGAAAAANLAVQLRRLGATDAAASVDGLVGRGAVER
jgi:Zn-dependent protease